MIIQRSLSASDQPGSDIFPAIFRALEAESEALIGPTRLSLLAIPLRDAAASVTGGLWGHTAFQWLHIQMLFVPPALRGDGVGSRLLGAAETEARARGCVGAHVDTLDADAARFYRRRGYLVFGVLEEFPPGHQRIFLQKCLGATARCER